MTSSDQPLSDKLVVSGRGKARAAVPRVFCEAAVVKRRGFSEK
jgi:hypothetical protein